MRMSFAVWFLLVGSVVTAADSAASLPELPDEARHRLEQVLGRWRVEAEFLAPDGSVARRVEWENRAEWVLDGRVVLLTHDAPALDVLSKAFVFYSAEDEEFYVVDVNRKGELWILSGGLDAFVLTSRPKRTDDGEMIVRFTHDPGDDDSMLVRMEYSLDDGATWTLGQRQRLTRIEQ